MKAISTDLRQRIIHAIKHEKNTPQQAATRFMVSQASVYHYLQLDRDLHNLEPAPKPPKPPRIRLEDETLLRSQIEANSDATLEEHRQTWFKTTGIKVGLTTMHRTLARFGITRKKRRSKPANATTSPAQPGSR